MADETAPVRHAAQAVNDGVERVANSGNRGGLLWWLTAPIRIPLNAIQGFAGGVLNLGTLTKTALIGGGLSVLSAMDMDPRPWIAEKLGRPDLAANLRGRQGADIATNFAIGGAASVAIGGITGAGSGVGEAMGNGMIGGGFKLVTMVGLGALVYKVVEGSGILHDASASSSVVPPTVPNRTAAARPQVAQTPPAAAG